MIQIEREQCIGCGICQRVCASHAISQARDKSGLYAIIDQERCTECGACLEVCPQGAIHDTEAPTRGQVVTGASTERGMGMGQRRGAGMGMGQGRGMGRGQGRGMGMGQGRGMGMGQGRGMGMGMGMGMGQGGGVGRGMSDRSRDARPTVPEPLAGPTREQDIAELIRAAQGLRQQLAETMARIDELDEREDG